MRIYIKPPEPLTPIIVVELSVQQATIIQKWINTRNGAMPTEASDLNVSLANFLRNLP